MSDDFVSQERLSDWLGAKRPADQVARLRAKGVPFDTNPAGKPVVLWSVVKDWMQGKVNGKPAPRMDRVK